MNAVMGITSKPPRMGPGTLRRLPMAKPPKTTQFTTSPQTTPNSPKLSPDEVAVNRTHTGSPDPVLTFNHPTETVATPAQQGAIVASPSVTVSHMPDTISAMLHTYLKAITWPDEHLHLLTAQDPDTGLFTSPQGDTYAHISGEGYFQVERQHDGGYRIYWPAALGEPGPLLTGTRVNPTGAPSVQARQKNRRTLAIRWRRPCPHCRRPCWKPRPAG